MRVAFRFEQLAGEPARRVVTVGNFDGVHRGHRAVLAAAAQIASARELEAAALTFEPHPVERLRPGAARLRLLEPQRKLELLAESGARTVLAQRFDERFAALSPEEFARDVLAGALGARVVIVGDNFRFGRDRRGDLGALRLLGEKLGFETRGHEIVEEGGAGISSSRIRDLLARGEVAAAREMLGRCHEVPGTVARGRGDGRRLGCPTINLDDVRVLPPGPGVYAALCDVDDRTHPAAAYSGRRPTLGHGPSLEAHLIGFEGDLYGRRVRLRFVERLRDELRFAGPEELSRQLECDVELARKLLESGDD
ncbi:MAG: riboflavin biosynthesis protein RibF [Polyangia bacterium]